MSKRQTWYAMRQANNAVEVDLFDEIGGWGVTAGEFRNDLREIDNGGEIRVAIDSPGGSVFDGMAIYAMLAERRERVHVDVYGVAASIASVIALAGATLTMRDGAFYMIHDPWSITVGSADEHRKTAEVLEKIADQIIEVYRQHTALTDVELAQAMRDETWYTAQEAVDAGFATNVVGNKAAALARHAMFAKFRRVPAELSQTAAAAAAVHREGQMDENTNATAAAPAEAFTAVNAKVDDLQQHMERLQASVEERFANIAIQPRVRPAFNGDEGAEWFYDALREATANRTQIKAVADAITTADGIGIPVAAAEGILMGVRTNSIMRRYGAEIRTAPAQSTRFSTAVDTGAAAIIAEGGSYTEQADPTLVTLNLHKIGGRFSVTEEAADDTTNLPALYAAFQRYAMLKLVRKENAEFLSGDGTGQPKGVDEETASVTAASHAAVTFDELVELDEALNPEWRWFTGSVASGDYLGPIYVVSSSTAEALRKLQDSNSNYFFRNHEENGMQTLFGKPLIRDANVANMGTVDAKTILLFHPAAYLIGERRPSIALRVGYDNNTHNVTWDFSERVGGQVYDTRGAAILKMAATT